MEIFNHYSLYIMLLMLVVVTVANGIIFYRIRIFDNLLLLTAFFLYASVLAINLFFGATATFDSQGQVLTETQGVLSITQTFSLQLLAHVLLAFGFSAKAYKIIKKT